MIGPALITAIRMARGIARERPDLFAHGVDAVTDQVDRLLELRGAPAETLRGIGRAMAVLLHDLGQPGADRLVILSRLMDAALAVQQLERVIPVRGVPPHPLPGLTAGATRNRPFAVIQGGRA